MNFTCRVGCTYVRPNSAHASEDFQAPLKHILGVLGPRDKLLQRPCRPEAKASWANVQAHDLLGRNDSTNISTFACARFVNQVPLPSHVQRFVHCLSLEVTALSYIVQVEETCTIFQTDSTPIPRPSCRAHRLPHHLPPHAGLASLGLLHNMRLPTLASSERQQQHHQKRR